MIAATQVAAMIQCTQCGRGNALNSQFCRFCGQRLVGSQGYAPQAQQQENPYAAPRPYAWKTDEYQTQSERRVQQPVGTQPMNPPFPTAYPLAHQGAGYYPAASYRCPNCGTSTLPIVERRISTAGWITFALLLVFTFIFFWIGLLIRENVTVCPVCRATLN